MKAWHTHNGYAIVRLLSGRCNVFAVLHSGRFVLVDAGGKRKRRLLMKRLNELCAGGNIFTALLLTHAHFDHAENAAAVAARYYVPVFASGIDMRFLSEGRNQAIRGVIGLTRLINWIPERRMANWFRYDPVQAMTDPGDSFGAAAGMKSVAVLPTPGHTPGSVSVIVDGEIALVGDAMHGVFPGNAFPPYAADDRGLLASWGILLQSGCGVFLPSHGGERKIRTVRAQFERLAARMPNADPPSR